MKSVKKVYSLKKVTGDYKCEKCGKNFKEERFLKKHLSRKDPCDTIYECDKCHRKFKEERFYLGHMDRKTPCAPDSIPVVSIDNVENRCHMCGKEYANAYNLKRHQKNCNVMTNPRIMMELLEQNREILKRLDKYENQQPQTLNQTVNVQQNIYMNVTFCSFGNEDLTKLDTNKVMNIIKNHADEFVPKMIEYVHANPEHPELHNVFYDSEREKAIILAPISDKEMSWQAHDIKDVSDKLAKKFKEHIRPGRGPYYDKFSQAKEYELCNKIVHIIQEMNWMTPEILEKNKISLSQITKNPEFTKRIETIEEPL